MGAYFGYAVQLNWILILTFPAWHIKTQPS